MKKKKNLISNFHTCHVKKGDLVKVIAGDEKGKEGIVISVNTKLINGPKVKIKGLCLKKVKNKNTNTESENKYLNVEGYIHASNVKLIKSGEENGK